MSSSLDKARRFSTQLKRVARWHWLSRQWKAHIGTLSSKATSPDKLFGRFDDEFWLWANTAGYREQPLLREMLPAMPPEGTQELFTGASGDQTLISAFHVYTQFKQIIERHYGRLSTCRNILDFGCGWGRITRFFLKDLDPSGIWAVDCLPTVVEICKQTNRWCNFQAAEPAPPTAFPDNRFDVIYSYSVFSHLSEEMHKKWLVEFRRILKPGGLVIATTRDRKFIQFCSELRVQENLSGHLKALTSVFPDTEQFLADYDRGSYCHHPLNGGEILNSSFFGETCIPRDYVLNHWTDHFTFLEYIYASELQPQNVIVVKKAS